MNCTIGYLSKKHKQTDRMSYLINICQIMNLASIQANSLDRLFD